MRNRIIALALCAGMLLLGGCASDAGTASSPSEPPVESTSSSVETEIPPEESGEPISGPEDPVEADEPEEIAGIIAMEADFTTLFNLTIFAIDPESGGQKMITTFTYPATAYPVKSEDNLYLLPSEYYYSSARQWVSDDFSKVATTLLMMSTGEHHAGWFTSDGTFFDVTAALGLESQNDFDSPAHYYALGFVNDYFVYCMDDKENDPVYYSVPIDNVTGEAVVTTNALYDAMPTHEYEYMLTDWIDDTRCLIDQGYESYRDRKTDSFIYDCATGEMTKYVPGDARYSWNGVASPDGTTIAFLSSAKEGKNPPNLYTVELGSDSPVQIETVLNNTVASKAGSPSCTQYPTAGEVCVTLLDWR